MKELLLLFILLNVVNVILQTAKSIATVKCGKVVASLVNAVAYGLYTVVIVYTNCDLPLWEKCLVVALANLVGVFVVKYFEEKLTKDKLWKVDFTILKDNFKIVEDTLKELGIPYYYNEYGKHTMFSTFCQTQDDTEKVANLVKIYKGKYFISENKGLLE